MCETQKSTTTLPVSDPPCRIARRAIWGGTRSSSWRRPILESPWIQRHIAVCPRCQRRFAAHGKVSLALQLARSQAHNRELLSRANGQVLKMLCHRVRWSPQAVNLPTTPPPPNAWERLHAYRSALTQMAACVALMVLGKIGLFGSMQKVQSRTESAVRSYYTQRLGANLAAEVFPDGEHV